MRDFLRGSLARGLNTLSAEDRLAAALPLVCGTALASHCRVERLDAAGTLHLFVSDREWLSSLLAMRDVLRSDLARTAGVPIAELRLETDHKGSMPTRARGTERPAQTHLPAQPRPRTRSRLTR